MYPHMPFRRAAVAVLIFLFGFGYASTLAAQDDQDAPAQILLDDLNQARSGQGLPPLAWDPSLAAAAQRHAGLMASTGMLEHQLPDEPGLAQRGSAAGAHFSSIADNIAEGGALHSIHASWMHSPAHYQNMMAAEFTVVGIGVAKRGRTIYAVEDFGASVADESLDSVESRVRDMLAIRLIQPNVDPRVARDVCALGKREYAGPPPVPGMVIQFTSPELDKLGPLLDQKVMPGRYSTASVGACADTNAQGFTRYKVALLLY
jgi:hypothetical protein